MAEKAAVEVMDPEDGWRALVVINYLLFEETTAQELWENLEDDPDFVNASKAILTACDLALEQPLEFDGKIDDALWEAICVLADAAGVDPKTGALPKSAAEISERDPGADAEVDEVLADMPQGDGVGEGGAREFESEDAHAS